MTSWLRSEPGPVAWASEAWSLERRGDELADIRYDGSLVLRAVRAVVRDRDWNTVPVASLAEALEGSSAPAPALILPLRFTGFGADLTGTLTLSVADDRLTIAFSATSHTDFLRNRIGLVLLHPPTVAGRDLAVTHPDGSRTSTAFPETIAPHQPARDIAALHWSDRGLDVAVRFTGDTFEMEDQRNWTDASFKTYSTPLDLPFPVLVPAGAVIAQSVEIAARRVAPEAVPTDSDIEFTRTDALVPEVVIGDAVEHLVVSSPAEIPALLDALRPGIRRLAVVDAATHVTEPELWAALVAGVASRSLDVELVGGTRAHFTELNRSHDRLPADLPALTFSITPQMHARENAQLVESIGMQRLVVRDALAIAAGRPLHVGPVTLRPRFNAVATSGADEPTPADERQASPALAAWTIASAAALFQPGVASVAWFDEPGVAGYPVAEAVEWLAGAVGHPLLVASGLPDHVWAFAAETEEGPVALVANLGDEAVTVRLGAPFEREVGIPPLVAARVHG